jgi:hypothetical protein
MPCGACGYFSSVKLLGYEILRMDVITAWQMISWEAAQAASRASKTGCCQQWQDLQI